MAATPPYCHVYVTPSDDEDPGCALAPGAHSGAASNDCNEVKVRLEALVLD